MYHFFDVEVAKEYGVDAAIVIANFQYWISYNAANRINYRDGQYWTFNSYKSLSNLFPYFSEKQIRRIMGELVDGGVLKVGNFNEKNYDNTRWYSFIDPDKWLKIYEFKPPAQTGKGAYAQMGNGMQIPSALYDIAPAQTGKPIPDNKLNIENDKETITSPNGDVGTVNFIIVGKENPPTGNAEKKKVSAEKRKEEPEPLYWKALVKIWFDFYASKKEGEEPTFNKTEGKQLKEIIKRLIKRSSKKKVEWSESNATNSLLHFLEYAHKDDWLSRNFMLKNILSNFDKIILDALGTNKGNSNRNGQQNVSGSSAFSKLSGINT